MTAPRKLRTAESPARQAVLRQLTIAAKAWSALEERYTAEGRTVDAQGAHQYGLWVLRALKAEIDNPGIARSVE